MENFRSIIAEFRLHGGVRQISAGEKDRDLQVQQLLEAFLQLLTSPGERESLGKSAHAILERNRGAARRTIEIVSAIYEKEIKTDVLPHITSG
jgi:hypothetical protein